MEVVLGFFVHLKMCLLDMAYIRNTLIMIMTIIIIIVVIVKIKGFIKYCV